jgi:excisionase family DNA binding protein
MDDAKFNLLTQELLSIRRLAQLLDCSPKTVQDWLYKDRKRPSSDPLPYYRIGGLVRFKPKEVTAWIERRRVRVGTLTFSREPNRI